MENKDAQNIKGRPKASGIRFIRHVIGTSHHAAISNLNNEIGGIWGYSIYMLVREKLAEEVMEGYLLPFRDEQEFKKLQKKLRIPKKKLQIFLEKVMNYPPHLFNAVFFEKKVLFCDDIAATANIVNADRMRKYAQYHGLDMSDFLHGESDGEITGKSTGETTGESDGENPGGKGDMKDEKMKDLHIIHKGDESQGDFIFKAQNLFCGMNEKFRDKGNDTLFRNCLKERGEQETYYRVLSFLLQAEGKPDKQTPRYLNSFLSPDRKIKFNRDKCRVQEKREFLRRFKESENGNWEKVKTAAKAIATQAEIAPEQQTVKNPAFVEYLFDVAYNRTWEKREPIVSTEQVSIDGRAEN